MTFIDDRRSRPLFPRGPGAMLRAIVLLVACAALMIRDARDPGLDGVRDALAMIVRPLVWVAALPGELTRVDDMVESQSSLRTRNQALRERQRLVDARLHRMDAVLTENRRLRELLGASLALRERTLAADVLSINQDPYRQQLQIDKGSRHGVYEGQALIDGDGVVGQVIEVHPRTSIALLVTDSEHGLPVENNRTGLQTIAQGMGDGQHLRLPFLPGNADIVVGDLLVSSPLGGRFPAGYPVGRVIDLRQRPGDTFKEAIAEPAAPLGQRRQLLLVWMERSDAQEGGPDAAPDGEASAEGVLAPGAAAADAEDEVR